jgi:hypothetical protein
VSERPRRGPGKPTKPTNTKKRAASDAKAPPPVRRVHAAEQAPSVVPPVDASGPMIRVTRMFESSASAVFAAFNDPARRAWSPEPLYRVLSALAPRFVRFALPDGAQVAVSITRQGNTRCAVTVEVTGLADRMAAARATARWRDGLGALAEQLDVAWD